MTLIDSLFTKGVKPSRRDICAINIRDKKKKKKKMESPLLNQLSNRIRHEVVLCSNTR